MPTPWTSINPLPHDLDLKVDLIVPRFSRTISNPRSSRRCLRAGAIVPGKNDTTGVGMVEIYSLN
ncbi:MAG: hypothetical protein H0W34_12875 [Pyrinomonadaceae bacterium]|nr:hypothetical protein [Pyrinomonadaceae bacterium]MBA3608586.1 hypothetical protein [Chthoniobacterales bacterium]